MNISESGRSPLVQKITKWMCMTPQKAASIRTPGWLAFQTTIKIYISTPEPTRRIGSTKIKLARKSTSGQDPTQKWSSPAKISRSKSWMALLPPSPLSPSTPRRNSTPLTMRRTPPSWSPGERMATSTSSTPPTWSIPSNRPLPKSIHKSTQ